MERVLHSGTDMVVSGGEKDLGFVLETPKGGGVDYGSCITVVVATNIAFALMLALF